MSVKDKLSDYLTEITFHTAARSPWQDKACTADLHRTRKWRHITCATEGLRRDKWHVQWRPVVYSITPSPVFSPLLCHILAHVHNSEGRKWFLLSGSVAFCVGVKLTCPQGTDLWPLCTVSYRAPSPSFFLFINSSLPSPILLSLETQCAPHRTTLQTQNVTELLSEWQVKWETQLSFHWRIVFSQCLGPPLGLEERVYGRRESKTTYGCNLKMLFLVTLKCGKS